MKDNLLVDTKAYQLARDYWPRQHIEGITASLIRKYLNPLSLNPKPTSKEDIYQRILKSAQNANMKAGVVGRSIGGVERLSMVLEGFNPKAVLDRYVDDWKPARLISAFCHFILIFSEVTQIFRRATMNNHIHHVHIFASDINKSIKFYEESFDGKIVLDMELAGARNVFMRIGKGRIHFYDQPPKFSVRGNIHHFGIQTDDIVGLVKRLKSNGVELNKDITDAGFWKYIMVPAPDDILIELFEVDKKQIPSDFQSYFE